MILMRYILASLWHHRHLNAGVVLSTLIGAAVLIGALWAEDAVRTGLASSTQACLDPDPSLPISVHRSDQATQSVLLRGIPGDRQQQCVEGPVLKDRLAHTTKPTQAGLFLSGSLFLMLASVILTAQFFALGQHRRQREIGILLAMGMRPGQVRRWQLAQGLVLAGIGTGLGVLVAGAYTRLLGWVLGRFCLTAVGLESGLVAADPSWGTGSGRSVAIGGLINGCLALAVMVWVLHQQRSMAVAACLAGRREELWPSWPLLHQKWKVAMVPGWTCLVLAMLLVGRAQGLPQASQGRVFFLSGALSLAGLLLLVRAGLWWLAGQSGGSTVSVSRTAWRTLGRQRGRNLTAVALLATGLFLIMSVEARRWGYPADPQNPASGAGGFLLWAQADQPLGDHPDDLAIRSNLGLDRLSMQGLTLLPWRLRKAAPNDCLHRQSPQGMPVLGVSAAALAQRQAFTFTGYWRPALEKDWQNPQRALRPNPDSPWWLLVPLEKTEADRSPKTAEGVDQGILKNPAGDDGPDTAAAAAQMIPETAGQRPSETAKRSAQDQQAEVSGEMPQEIPGEIHEEIPGVVDVETLRWVLGRQVGDRVQVQDGRGRWVWIRIVGAVQRSVWQGALVVDERSFLRLFPEDDGYRGVLVALPAGARRQQVQAVQEALSIADGHGELRVTTTSERLARLHAKEHAFLDTFQILAALGLLLGSTGLAVVLLRQAEERRGELAMLWALGWTRTQLRGLLVIEQILVLWMGTVCGALASRLVLEPMGILASGPIGVLWRVMFVVVVGAILAILTAAWWALREAVLPTLTREIAGR